ncbi:MAG: hypothetical protein OXM01_08915 [Gemmatimonadota bacterium]|nr:hypothetical protein [Gemmatimonadota bacterium]
MSKQSKSRDTILQYAGIAPSIGRQVSNAITAQDYAAVPPPLNLQVQPVGDCLIWLGRLNSDGYGTGRFPGSKEALAHRAAYEISRGQPAADNVLHLCHRRFRIQPSHLYDGSAKENNQDRRLRTSQGLHTDLFAEKSEIVQAVAR